MRNGVPKSPIAAYSDRDTKIGTINLVVTTHQFRENLLKMLDINF